MKKFINEQKKCLLTMISLIVVCELLLKINNKIIQSIGIMVFPFIIVFGYLLIKSEQNKRS